MTDERKDFECTPEPAVVEVKTHRPEPSASFECTPPTARVGVKPPPPRVVDVIADVARAAVRGLTKR